MKNYQQWTRVFLCYFWLFIPAISLANEIIINRLDISPETSSKRAKIGIALSGGGARGLAHVGVLQALEELRIPVDYVAGTSMGSIVGGLYAIGLNAEELTDLAAKQIQWTTLLDNKIERSSLAYREKQNQQRFLELELGYNQDGFSVPSGFINAQELLAELIMLTDGIYIDFNQLPIPFAAVATDLNAAKPYLLERGDLAMALRASMAVPFAFSPVEIDGKLLVDGGILNNIPVDVVRNMGADIVIAINIETPLPQLAANSSFISVTEQTIYAALLRNSQEALQKADVVVIPNLDGFTSTDFIKALDLMKAGYQAIMDKAALLQLLSLSEADYLTHLAQRKKRKQVLNQSIIPEFIEFTGNYRTPDALLKQQVNHLLKKPLVSSELRTVLNRLMAFQDLAQVSYRVIQRDGQSGLIFDVQKKSWGPNYFRFGLNAATTFDDKIEFTALLRHERLNIGTFSGEWINEFTIGGDYQYYTEYYQPLMINQRFFLKPYGKIGRYFKDGYEAHQLIGEYDLRRSQLGLDIGMNIDNVAQILTGLRYQDLTARLRVGNPKDLHVGTTQQAGWHLRFDYDDLNHRVFAKEGSQLHFHAVAYDDAIAGDLDYHKLVFYGRHHWPINERRVLFSEITLGTFLKSEPPFYDRFSIGGSDGLAGFSTHEISGQHAMLLRFGGILNPPFLSEYLPGEVRLLSLIHTGNVWDNYKEISLNDLRYGGSIALLWDTRLGAVFAGMGYTKGGDIRFFLNLGNLYLRGFEFDG